MRLNLNTPSIPNYLHVFILGLLPVLCGLGAMALGKDINWDLRNYHYYDAYAFVNQRYDLDIAPAQLQTFYNPLLDLPFYFMAQAFPARRIGFILGCVHGLNLSIIYLIFCNLTRYAGRYTQMLIGLGVVAVSAIAPGFLSELGGTMNDNVASLGVLFAILLLFSAHGQAPGHSRWLNGYVILAGLVMGLTVGLKPVTAIYAIGTALSLPLLFPAWRSRAICFLLYGLAGGVGGVSSAGFWWWELWSRFGNPVFPYFNNIFQSPYVLAGRYNDMVFVPRQAWEYWVWPILFSLNSKRVAEFKFFDIRFGVLYISLGIWGLSRWFKTQASPRHFQDQKVRFLIGLFVIAFVMWMTASSIYRYLLTLELLTPILFLALVERIVPARKIQAALIVTVTAALLLLFQPLSWGRTDWSSPYIAVQVGQSFQLPDDAVVVMLGYAPISYVIPHFPATVRFIRPDGNLLLQGDDRFLQTITQVVNDLRASDKLFVLFHVEDIANRNLEIGARKLGFDPARWKCYSLQTSLGDQMRLCQVNP